jgi:hypothetical protein
VRRAVFALPLLAAALACGGSSSNGTPAEGADAGDAATIDAAAEAGLPTKPDQDPNVYPATHHPLPLLVNEKGAILFMPKIATVTFVGDALRDTVWTFDDAVVASDWWHAVATPYNIADGVDTGLGPYELADTVSGKTLDDAADLQPLLQQAVSAGKLPKPDSSTLYVVYIPASTTVINRDGLKTCQGIGGYHDATSITLPGNPAPQLVAYAVIARCTPSTDDLTFAASHEIIEAVTDAHPSNDPAWYMIGYLGWTGPGGGESADVCYGRGPIASGGSMVARSWVNAAASASHDPCQPAAAGQIYFQTAMDTATATVTDSWGTYPSDGFLVVKRGTTKGITGTVFSEAALPNDLTLLVGAPNGSTDPTQLSPIATGVTATLSRTTGHNGQAVTLAVSVDASAPTGDSLFVVRSILSPTEWHSWPVVLRVQP